MPALPQPTDDASASPLAEELIDTLGRTGDAMVAVDGELRVSAWNAAATELFGYEASEVLGRPCWEVLEWSDRCGNAVCDECCAAAEPGPDDEVVATRDVIGYHKTGRTMWLSATTVVPRTELRDRVRLVHLVREVAFPLELERIVAGRLQDTEEPAPGDGDAAERLARLSDREWEVLCLLAEGESGRAIADRLYLSPTTVRNHVQHILGKLEVHSRVEAVALLLRHGKGRPARP